MKQQCDNHCETCPMQSQIYCALMYAKANNESMGGLEERLSNIESSLQKEDVPEPLLINPLAGSFFKEEETESSDPLGE